ncbi:IclR family transcriptional regulator [Demequina zhanjiangensis]|uniref:IclR family transcriptional regulator n=1 Tax=Demequina zhanjiangensis TaxID=3051659 RepID=A0ABT8FXK2_9MICO|nr:IclR family transcriptional regulator [Demequina sp. SYSU T00b26]MDN4471620.1 IclR family transcriptional regulator [Demequina sp. SYSU T00b26]
MIQAIDRAAGVLHALQGARHLGITELASELGLAPSTVHGIVKSLQAHGLVVKEPGSQRYMLGPTLLKLSNVYLDTHEVRARAMQWTRELARRTGCSIRLGVQLFDEVLVIHHNRRPDGSQQMYETGLSLPSHASALGKVLLAYDLDFADKVLEGALRPLTGDTVTEPTALRKELEGVVSASIATERDEAVLGESAVAAPICDRSGAVVAAVEIVMPTTEYPPSDEVLNDLRQTARTISREVGGSDWPPRPMRID